MALSRGAVRCIDCSTNPRDAHHSRGQHQSGEPLTAGAVQVTYPLDTLRMRLALDPSLKTIPMAILALLREGGPTALYRGVGPAVVGIAPYMAMELAMYDTLPSEVPSFARGFTAALVASTCFYPLDTVRRQIQIQSAKALPLVSVLRQMYAKEGVLGFYRGFLPNALKNLPNKGASRHLLPSCTDCLDLAVRALRRRGRVQVSGCLSSLRRRRGWRGPRTRTRRRGSSGVRVGRPRPPRKKSGGGRASRYRHRGGTWEMGSCPKAGAMWLPLRWRGRDCR